MLSRFICPGIIDNQLQDKLLLKKKPNSNYFITISSDSFKEGGMKEELRQIVKRRTILV
jgi:hypothetical protein